MRRRIQQAWRSESNDTAVSISGPPVYACMGLDTIQNHRVQDPILRIQGSQILLQFILLSFTRRLRLSGRLRMTRPTHGHDSIYPISYLEIVVGNLTLEALHTPPGREARKGALIATPASRNVLTILQRTEESSAASNLRVKVTLLADQAFNAELWGRLHFSHSKT